MEKINIAKLLEDCPKGMELDCTTWENVTLYSAVNDTILIMRNDKVPAYGSLVVLNKYGRVTDHQDEKCRIFPKGKTTWEGFQRPWIIQDAKDGDVVSYGDGWTCIFKCIHGAWYSSHCFITIDGEFHTGYDEHSVKSTINGKAHLATKEQCDLLFQKIKEAGYKWNPETKTLEKLPKFKDGDIITCTNAVCTFTAIFKDKPTEKSFRHHCSIINDNTFTVGLKYADYINPQFATEAEKQRLFNAIKENGYKWNLKTKTLDKLIKPIFKKGDKVKVKNGASKHYIINNVEDTFYTLVPTGRIYFIDQDNWELAIKPIFKVGDKISYILGGFIGASTQSVISEITDDRYIFTDGSHLSIGNQDYWKLVIEPAFKKGDKVKHKESGIHCIIGDYAEGLKGYHTNIGLCIADKDIDSWEVVPNKFDINTLKPFDKVLVRDKNIEEWCISFFERCNRLETYKYSCINGSTYARCIPYEGNEHLRGTTNDCDDFYKTWE